MPSQPREITLRAIILVIILAGILAASNAYLGLKVGITVSASIPAAIISMGILRMFKNSNILENNIVQTGASAGEAMVSGAAFVLPALLIVHYWTNFNYWETVLIALVGGVLGVLISIPIRRVLLADKDLPFPEGTAIGRVLKVTHDGGGGLKELLKGGAMGSLIAFFQSGVQIIGDSVPLWFKVGDKFIYGLTFGFEPALIAAGYIVGITLSISLLVGIIIGWIIGIPILSHISGVSSTVAAATQAHQLFISSVRPIGVGTMMLGGFWTIITLFKPIAKGLKDSFVGANLLRKTGRRFDSLPIHERDIPINYVLIMGAILLIPLGYLLFHFLSRPELNLHTGTLIGLLIMSMVFVVIIGFILASLCGYFVGLLGSSNSPISGITLCALILASLLLLLVLKTIPHFMSDPARLLEASGFTLVIAALICSACAITNENIQDFKAGQLVGATPWKQQVILLLGVLVAALVMAPVLDLLYNAYGIGTAFPRAGMNPANALSAPQAIVMASIVQGAFRHNLPWHLIEIGFAIAFACIVIDLLLRKRNLRLPVLAVGSGIYLPLEASVPVIIGGIAAYLIEQALQRKQVFGTKKIISKETLITAKEGSRQRGLTTACGIVAGASLMGVILAIPFTLAQSADVLRWVPPHFQIGVDILGALSAAFIINWLYKTVCRS